MSDAHRGDTAHAHDPALDADRDAKIEQLLLVGLDHYFAAQYDQAINAFKDLAQRKDGPLPVDGILMQLGRTYRDAGKSADAQQTFNRLVEESPESPFTGDAKKEIETLKKAS